MRLSIRRRRRFLAQLISRPSTLDINTETRDETDSGMTEDETHGAIGGLSASAFEGRALANKKNSS